jgi:hypothetical protein
MGNPAESDRNGKHDSLAAESAQKRIAELEAKNDRLRSELAKVKEEHAIDRECLISHMIDDLPSSEEEFLRQARDGPTFRELLDELGFTKASGQEQ